MKVLLANPHGFCAGVVMAIQTLERSLELFGPPLYVYHEIVHNNHVVQSFRRRGVVFVDEIADVPEGGRLVYSARRWPAGASRRDVSSTGDNRRHLSARFQGSSRSDSLCLGRPHRDPDRTRRPR